jgi:hypothetical protein
MTLVGGQRVHGELEQFPLGDALLDLVLRRRLRRLVVRDDHRAAIRRNVDPVDEPAELHDASIAEVERRRR